MSGIAAAKKRRAGVTTTIPEAPRLPNGGLSSQPQQQTQPQGLTLQQVIALLDSRITKLERESIPNNQIYSKTEQQNNDILPSNISEILDDFQEKFVILAGEINSLKDTVLKLQSYTMDVNKILLEERIQILSDIGDNVENRFLLNSDNDNDNDTNNDTQTEEQKNNSYNNQTFVFETLEESKINI